MKYLEGKRLVKVEWFLGGFLVQITADGVDEVERTRSPSNSTFTKDAELREKMLRFLYNAYWKDPQNYVNKTDLMKTLNSESNDTFWAMRYLRDKGLIEVMEFIGGHFMAKITHKGIDAIENTGVTQRPLLFISHSHKNKDVASFIKMELHDFGIDVFVAHEDISPTEEWQKVILKKLKQCTGILLLLTEDFKESDWTDQETGFALALDKIVIPIKSPLTPYGFVSKYQALPWRRDEDVNKLIELLVDKKIISIDMLIQGFAKSKSSIQKKKELHLRLMNKTKLKTTKN